MNKNTDPRWLEWAKELQFGKRIFINYTNLVLNLIYNGKVMN